MGAFTSRPSRAGVCLLLLAALACTSAGRAVAAGPPDQPIPLAQNPASFKARINLAALELAENHLDLAQSRLQVARALYPGSPRLPTLSEALRHAELDARSRERLERRQSFFFQ
jgi:hypothetical protein